MSRGQEKPEERRSSRSRRVLAYLIAGCVGSVVGFITIFIFIALGASRPLPFNLLLVPLSIPVMIALPVAEAIWSDVFIYYYQHLAFYVLFYFPFGMLVHFAYSKLRKRTFYILVSAVPAVLIIATTIAYESYGFHLFGRPGFVSDFFYMKSRSVKMPVLVAGNSDSKTMIVLVHGGPGDSMLRQRIYPAFRALEENYLLVYWDQRASGNSIGNPGGQAVTLAQLADDLDRLIDFLKEKYHPESVFLYGHSFGGELTAKYLISSEHQRKISGWIEVDGSHNIPLEWEVQRKWLMEKARDFMGTSATEQENEFWQKALEFAATHERIGPWQENTVFKDYIGPAMQKSKIDPPEPGLFPRGELWNLLGHQNEFVWRKNIRRSKRVFMDALQSDYTPELKKITIPSLLLWGRHDMIVPLEIGVTGLDALGTSEDQKKLVIFENSGHNPMITEQEKFYRTVREWTEILSNT